MKRTVFPRLTLAAAVALLAAGCREAPTNPGAFDLNPSFSVSGAAGQRSYVILASSATLRAGFAQDVAAAGGTNVAALDRIGVVVATSSDPNFAAKAAKISGVRSVALDRMVQWVAPTQVAEEIVADEAGVDAQAVSVGAVETFRALQWAPDAVNAPAAWDAGHQGLNARVAILDGGIRSTHIDIAPNLDVQRSTSFACRRPPPVPPDTVPGPAPVSCAGNEIPFNSDTGTFWHGTHVAGIVGAPANNIGTVGIAPKATLIGVKVLQNGSGLFSWIIRGIVYAATPISEGGAGAHIINMSLGATFWASGGDAQLLAAVSRATSYANQRGVTVVAAAGNEGVDLDHSGHVVSIPAQSVGVLAVSALAPRGWAVPNATWSLDRPASYTNFGQSAIHLAGPGGDTDLFDPTPKAVQAVCQKPLFPAGTLTQFCYVLDMVMAPCRGGPTSNSSYCWGAGTSMASPAVAGVAALIVGRHGPMHPSQLRAILERSADDLGKPGNDDFYGGGRVNAGRAVQ
jgi:lantibiotic leader peptide-processing serine protease